MRKMNRTERAAAMLVVTAAAAVAGAGYKLLKKHTAYVVQKATAFFKNDAETEELDKVIQEEAAEAEQTVQEESAEAEEDPEENI